MRRIFLFASIFVFILMMGCNKSPEVLVGVRSLAYQSVDELGKKTILNWQNAEVLEYKTPTDHRIKGLDGFVNIKDKSTYKVTFRTNDEAILGTINVYIDKDTNKVLGEDLRD